MGGVRIGHASISENGTVAGKKGDQSKREVCIREWYAKGWNVVLRPRSAKIAEETAKACEDGCKNDNIGYSQFDFDGRNSAYKEWQKCHDMKKIGKSNTDCSAFMTLCAIAGGVVELNYTINAPTTSTMRRAFVATEKYEALTASKYLNSSEHLKRGDILVHEGHHTAMVLDNGAKIGKKNTTLYYPACSQTETSIVNALQSLKIDSNMVHRKKIAEANGMSNYSGTAKENIQLLILLKKGKLKRES